MLKKSGAPLPALLIQGLALSWSILINSLQTDAWVEKNIGNIYNKIGDDEDHSTQQRKSQRGYNVELRRRVGGGGANARVIENGFCKNNAAKQISDRESG